MRYFAELKKSWELLKQNWVLLLPYFLGIGLMLAVVIFFSIIGGIILVAFIGLSIFRLSSLLSPSSYSQLGSGPIIFLVVTGIALFLALFLVVLAISAWIEAMALGMYKEACLTGKTSKESMFPSGRKYFGILFRTTLFSVLVLLLLPLALLSVPLVIALVRDSSLFAIIYGIIAAFLYAVYWLFVYAGLFFAPVLVTLGEQRVFPLVKRSFRYLFEKPRHVLSTFGVVFLAYAILFGTQLVFRLIGELVARVAPVGVAILTMLFLLPVVVGLRAVQFLLAVVLSLFRFRSYFIENKIKARKGETF